MKLKTKLNLLSDTLKQRGLNSSLNLCLSYLTLKLEPSEVPTEPIYLQLEPTTRCNLKCKMCYGTYDKRACDDLSFDGFQRIINQFPKLIKLNLQGIGEPLLNKDIFGMIKYAKSKGIKVEFTTNATLIGPAAAKEIISSGLDYIEFSIDSPIAKTYEEIRPGANFEQVVANVKKLIQERGDAEKPEMKITAVVIDENVEEIPQLVEFTDQLGINSLLLIDVQPWGKDYLKKPHYKHEVGFSQRVKQFMFQAQKVAENLGVFLDLSTPATTKMVRACKRPWLSVSILTDGYVVPCCRVISPDEINFGNIFKESFKDIWNCAEYRAFRKALKSNHSPATCSNCCFYYRNPMVRDHI